MTLENAIVNGILNGKNTVDKLQTYCSKILKKNLSKAPIRMILHDMIADGRLIAENGKCSIPTFNAWHS